MKKILTNRLFLVLLTAIIVASGTAYATIKIQATEIGYDGGTWKKSDGTDITNAKEAIDELYLKANKDLSFGNTLLSKSYGNAINTRTANIDLNKGKYIVHVVTTVNGGNPSTTSEDIESNVSLLNAASDNTTIQKLNNHMYKIAASEADIQGNNRWIETRTASYYVVVSNDVDTLSVKIVRNWNSNVLPDLISIQAIPIN